MKVSLSVLSPSIGPFFRRGRLIYAHKRDLSGRVVGKQEVIRDSNWKATLSIGDKSRFHSLTLKNGEQTAQACANAWLRQRATV